MDLAPAYASMLHLAIAFDPLLDLAILLQVTFILILSVYCWGNVFPYASLR